jgi:hypothetical protein
MDMSRQRFEKGLQELEIIASDLHPFRVLPA